MEVGHCPNIDTVWRWQLEKNHELTSLNEVEAFLEKNKLCMIYVSRPECSVCHALIPKLREMLVHYPHIHFGHINANQVEAVAAKFLIFTVPTILLTMDQKEYIRANQFVRFDQLKTQIDRVYQFAMLDEGIK